MDNLLANFFTESQEHLGTVEDDIIKLEKSGKNFDKETVNRLFRAMHSIKGGSGFLELSNITQLAHSLENVIDNIRNAKLIANEYIADTLLKGVDKLKELIDNIDNESNIDIRRETSDLKQLISSPIVQQPKHEQDHKSTGSTKFTLSHEKIEETKVVKKKEIRSISIEKNHRYKNKFVTYYCSVDLIKECDNKNKTPEELLRNLKIAGRIINANYDLNEIGTLDKKIDDKLIFNFTISTVIEDIDTFAEALDIKPLSIKKIIDKEEVTALTDHLEAPPQLEPEKKTKNYVAPPVEKKSILKKILKMASLLQKKEPVSPVTAAPVKKELVYVSTVKTDQKNLLRKSFLSSKQQDIKPDIKKPVSSTVRIPLDLLDHLMNYASELVLVRNRNMQAVDKEDIDELRKISKKLNIVTSGLQAGILKTRMQPVDIIFSKFTRVVRDISRKEEKDVTLVIEGKHVELDKTIIEALSDPLTHLIRNAIGHGIEHPDEREGSGKPRKGKILLGAYYIAGQVNIKITDDGKGMNPSALINSAVNKGIITGEQAEKMKDDDVFNLIFQPGFSTAEKITDLSGRGVGMDVVKTNLQNIGGTINISSVYGKGTTFDIRLPMTLSIMQALIVKTGNICFAIPQFSISEVLSLQGENVYTDIKKINEQEVFSLRDKLIPLVRLKEVLKIKSTYIEPGTKKIKEDRRKTVKELTNTNHNRTAFENHLNIIILKFGNIPFGLIIDNIIDTKEIVIKPIHEQLKKYQVYAGTTVLGDGDIALILDIANLAEKANFKVSKNEIGRKKEKIIKEDSQPFIIFTIGGKENFAIPLFLISHIEKINLDEIMMSGNKEYFKFQDEIIQIIRIDNALENISSNYINEVFVIIIKTKKPIGILVSRIIDTSMIASAFDSDSGNKPGILGIIMNNSHLTTILDIFAVIEIVQPDLFIDNSNKNIKPKKVMLLEDTRFYSSIITSYLNGLGVETVICRNGNQGLEILGNTDFDIILSDLLMPVMDGFEFAKKVRSNRKYDHIKLIALSSACSESEGEITAKEAGFDMFVSKLNREAMIECLNSVAAGFGD